MTRGCEKRIIHIKDTDSALFEEAYFVLRSGVTKRRQVHSEDQMIKEANRLIKDSLSFAYPSKSAKKSRSFIKAFIIGAAFSGVLSVVIGLTLFLVYAV